jgi:hypothetical protein
MDRRTFLSFVAAGGACVALPVAASEKKAAHVAAWLKASAPTPGLGVYLGAGCKGTQRLKQFEAWLGRDVDQTIEFIGWNVLAGGTTWGVRCWDKAAQPVIYSIPMLPPKNVATLADGAKGRFDEHFRKYAALLVQNGFRNSVIRIGWEFNAHWYPWRASNDPAAWTDYWRRIVSLFRATPDASFKFDWCPAAASKGFDATRVYPGDEFVDFVGLDFYNMPIDQKKGTPEQRWTARMNMQHGLKWQKDFAQSHRKRMSIPEWGTGPHTKHGGAHDDAYFIEQMAQWIAANKIAYHNYWEYKNKELDTRLTNGSQPKAQAAFIRLFGDPARSKLNASSEVSA